jgi:hypothetical protein
MEGVRKTTRKPQPEESWFRDEIKSECLANTNPEQKQTNKQ